MKYKVQLLITQLFSIAQKTKLGIIIVSDAVFSFLAALLALVVSTDLVWKDSQVLVFAAVIAFIRVTTFAVFRLYSYSWRFASTRQFKFMYAVILLGSGVIALSAFLGVTDTMGASLSVFVF